MCTDSFHLIRLLDVDDDDEEIVTLNERDKVQQGHRCVTIKPLLGDKPLTTPVQYKMEHREIFNQEQISVEAFMSGISISRLSKTLRDAIAVARGLEIRYL